MDRKKLEAFKKRIAKKYPDKYTEDMCLARVVDRENGRKRFCRQTRIGLNGRCSRHGGNKHIGKPTSKIYSRYIKDTKFKKIFKKFCKDPEIGKVDAEIAHLRSLAIKFQNLDRQEDPYRFAQVQAMIVDTAGKMVERYHKIQGNYFNMNAVNIVINNIVAILNDSIKKCPKCRRSLKNIRKSIFEKLQNMPVLDPDRERDINFADATLPDGTFVPSNVEKKKKRERKE